VQSQETHPRPQLTRDRWTDLCGPWQFAYDDENVGLRSGWVTRTEVFDRTIQAPFPPESPASGVGDTGPHPVVWYRREFQAAAPAEGEALLLNFGAVDYRASVWVNGQHIAEHEGGHTPFAADITNALHPDGETQVLVVRAEDQASDLAQPRGKQDWLPTPHKIWYHRTTGIWQPVWLERVSCTHIVDIRWTPDLERGLLGFQVRLSAQPRSLLHLRIQLTHRGEALTDDTYTLASIDLRRDIALDINSLTMGRDRLLWSPEHPNLLEARVTLLDGDRVLDDVGSYAGLRDAGFSSGRFLLNGRPYYLRLALHQGYWHESHLAAPSDAALRREVELIKSLGFNGVRIHQKVEDPRFLYWCDRLGLLVWGEMANAYIYSTTAVERLVREWVDVLRRDYSHPCIVTWVPLNESWGVPALERDPAQQSYVRALYHLTRALDPTRPVIGNDGWEHLASDVWGIHDYAPDGDTIRERYGTPEAVERTLREVQPHYRTLALPEYHRKGEPVVLTECGGISYAPAADEKWFGYGVVHSADEYLAKYEDLITAILDCPTIAGFCYTQVADTQQETNGLLTADRTPKLDPQRVREINLRPSRSTPGETLTHIHAAREVTPFQGGGA
jgi:beta-galactosidase/beta-glucuronidase